MGNFCCFISKKVENRRDKDIFQEEIKCQNIIEEKQIEFELEKEIEHEIFKEVNLKDNIEINQVDFRKKIVVWNSEFNRIKSKYTKDRGSHYDVKNLDVKKIYTLKINIVAEAFEHF